MTPGCNLEECKQEHLAMLHPSFLQSPAPETAVHDSYDGMTIFCEGGGSYRFRHWESTRAATVFCV